MDARTFRNLAIPASSSFSRAARLSVAWLLATPLGGCSFDLGSWGADKEKPPPVAEKPTDNISARSVNDSQGYATRGQVLAKSGKTEEALAEFDRALALDPYNVQALYGRAPDLSGREATPAGDRGFHRGQRPLAAKGRAVARPRHQLPGTRQGQGSGGGSRRGGAGRSRTAQMPGQPAARPTSGSATRPRRPNPMAARSTSARKTKPRAAALPASAAKQASKPGRSFSKRRLTSAARRGTSTSPPTACLRRPTYARARAAGSPRHAGRADG